MPTNTGANSVEKAAETISGLLNPAPLATPEATPEVTPESQPATTAAPVETTPESLAPATPPGETEAPKLYDVPYGDTTEQRTIDQLISGNMMERDYRFKTGKLGERDTALTANEAKVAQQIVDLEAALQHDAENFNSPEMLELKGENPAAYWERFEVVKVRADLLNKAKAEQAESVQATANTNRAKEMELLHTAIPDWLDPGKKSTQWSELSVYESGFGRDINTVSNHRDIVNARKAMLYDRIMSQDIEANKDNPAPKSTAPAAPVKEEVTTAEQGLKDTLKKTGRRQDAQALMKSILQRPAPS